MPALEMEMLCCSIASWIEVLHRSADQERGAIRRNAPVCVVHLVKLVDEAHTLVRQHERAALQRPLAGHWVTAHTGCETDCRGALPGGKHRTGGGLFHVLEELGLGRTRVTQQEHVNVATDAVLAPDILGHAAEQAQRDGRLDILMPVDARRDALDDALANTVIAGKCTDRMLVVFSETERRVLILSLIHI